MNKKYFLRQLTLNELGIDSNKDIQECYNYFCIIVGNIEELTKMESPHLPERTFWYKGTDPIIRYDIYDKKTYVSYDFIYIKLQKKYNFSYIKNCIILSAFIEYFLKIEVDFVECSLAKRYE